MPSRLPESPILRKNIWTSVINAFQPLTLKKPLNDMIWRGWTNTTLSPLQTMKKMSSKLKKRADNREEILTFDDWKDPEFTCVTDLECTDKWSNWSPEWPVAKEWNDIYGQMC